VSDADRYRLAPVRDARVRDERVRKGDLASAASDARRTQARLDAAHDAVTTARAALAAAVTQGHDRLARGATADEVTRAERYVMRLRHALAAAQDAHARAHAVHRGQLASVDLARGRLASARADKEVIERHFARWRADQAKLAERRED